MKYIITFSMILVFGTISYVSILGLSLFLSAGMLSYFIGAGLELGKLSSIIYVHQNWDSKNRYLYIFIAVIIALLTTFEVAGYLSYKHAEATQEINISKSTLLSLSEEKAFLKKQIDKVEQNLKELPHGFVKRKQAARNSKSYKANILRIKEIIKEERMLSASNRIVVSGSAVFALARLTNIKAENIARIFITILVVVWELLSTALIVAFSSVWRSAGSLNMHLPGSRNLIGNDPANEDICRNSKLKALMENNDLSVSDIAGITGRKNIETVIAWINGKSEIPEKALNSILKQLRN